MKDAASTSLHDYGELLLASRLKRVSERLYAGVDEVYGAQDIALSSRCFPILFLLRDHGRLGISELAAHLGQSHPAVSQMSRKLLDHGVVRESADPKDERRRLLSLAPRGVAMMRKLPAVWQAIEAAVRDLQGCAALSEALTGIDRALSQRPFAQRIRARLADPGREAVEIIPFEARYRRAFKRLNVEWLEKYFRVEPIDEAVLSQPEAILRNGGAIFLARLRGRVIGTCALLKEGGSRYELSKMSVTADCQGLGIGRRLMAAAIREYHALGGTELYLETNSVLTPAITLYESVGFEHATRPVAPAHYDRADVYMIYRPASPPPLTAADRTSPRTPPPP